MSDNRTKITTIAELIELPMDAVVYDHNNQVWQKLTAPKTIGWYKPGDPVGYSSADIALSAYLLDDGL